MVKNEEYFEEALMLYETDPMISGNMSAVAKFLKHKYNMDSTKDSIRTQFNKLMKMHYADKELVTENVKLAKGKQRSMDQNRIANKSFREHARIENALGEFAKSQLQVYKKHAKALNKIKLTPLHESKSASGVGVIQITDLHGNELVDLPHNTYDFNVLSKRLKLHISEACRHFKQDNYKKVAMFFTGDLLNSDRRLDELLLASTNRAKATSLMRHIITQAILDVRNQGFEVTIVSVLGNESRVGKEMPFSNEGLSDNYDFMIMDGIRQAFDLANIEGVTWGGVDKVEEIVTVDDSKWLLAHNISGMVNTQKNAQSGIGRLALNGNNIRFMIGGHIHATNIGDFYARSGSTVGANSYSENALGLFGYAAQNYYLCRDGRITKISVDLQNIEDVNGYSVIKELEAYNAKSVSKTKINKTVFEVVI